MFLTPYKQKPERMETLRDYIDSMFEDTLSNFGMVPTIAGSLRKNGDFTHWKPAIELHEDENTYTVKAALPGVNKEDVDIEVNENSLTITGEHKVEKKVEEENLYRSELNYGKFSRSFAFNKPIDVKKVKSTYKDGMLTLELGKQVEEKKDRVKIRL